MSEGNWINLRFVSGAGDTEDLEAEISSILENLSDPVSDVAKSACAARLDPSDMRGARVRVTKEAKGFDPTLILIAISVPAASHIVNQFWDDVIWPHLKKRLGADSLGKREENDQDH